MLAREINAPISHPTILLNLKIKAIVRGPVLIRDRGEYEKAVPNVFG